RDARGRRRRDVDPGERGGGGVTRPAPGGPAGAGVAPATAGISAGEATPGDVARSGAAAQAAGAGGGVATGPYDPSKLLGVYRPADPVFVAGRGSYVIDEDGR